MVGRGGLGAPSRQPRAELPLLLPLRLPVDAAAPTAEVSELDSAPEADLGVGQAGAPAAGGTVAAPLLAALWGEGPIGRELLMQYLEQARV